ncbi:hypothetical protein DXG01_016679, partial [Tephrocybe rancida]
MCSGRGADRNGGVWAVVDEEGLAQIAQLLSEQQAGLAHLTKVLRKAQKDRFIGHPLTWDSIEG